jgi:hypothetical protein
VPQAQQELGWVVQAAGVGPLPGTLEANTENFFVRRVEPHLGQAVPFERWARTRISLSASHCSQ